MNRELRRISIVILTMFVSLFIASTSIQALSATDLAKDPRNVRTLFDSYRTKRGALLVDGNPIAISVKTNDAFHYQRTYSNQMYSAITGYFSVNQGASGLEQSMNDYLSGRNSSQFFDQINALLSGNAAAGASVELTIDPVVQKAAYEALGNLKGAVVAIDPKTGNILAMVSKPTFDANRLTVHSQSQAQKAYSQLINAKTQPLISRAIAGALYPPGSTFKLVVAAAAFESGKYSPQSMINNPRKFKLPGTNTYIYNSGEGKCGGASKVSIADALRFSCNIPFAQLGIALGQDRLRSQAQLFGFGKSIDIPIRSSASVFPENLDAAQTGLSSFGQFDVRVTPLQMAMVSAAIANGGSEMKPNLIENVQSSTLAILSQPQPQVYSQPISKQTAALIKEMMVNAVAHGVSSNAQISGVKVAGKTGTAQNGAKQPYTLWFTGFAPADNPQVAVAVVIEDGGGMGQSGFGNLLAAPVARKVMKAVLRK
jgi:peptidoglycan glycosyltransferase